MSILLGNLTLAQIEDRTGISISADDRDELNKMRQENAENIQQGKWHCFDLPFMVVCGDRPTAEKQHFQMDRFEDSLARLCADAHLLAGKYEQETVAMLVKAFATAVPLPPHGRLIDADALYIPTEEINAKMAVVCAPTIIEAEVKA